jgi:hypothetical protein
MAALKGHPRWGGRIKGTPNKATVQRARMISEALAPIVAEGKLLPEHVATMQPLDVLLLIMRKRLLAEDWNGAVVAAQSAAPYVHSRVTIVDTTVRHVTEQSDAELDAELTALRAKVNQARQPLLIEARAEAPEPGIVPQQSGPSEECP